jgi:hypothetical protein
MRIVTLLLFLVFTYVKLFSQIVNYDEVYFKKVLINQLPIGGGKI